MRNFGHFYDQKLDMTKKQYEKKFKIFWDTTKNGFWTRLEKIIRYYKNEMNNKNLSNFSESPPSQIPAYATASACLVLQPFVTEGLFLFFKSRI